MKGLHVTIACLVLATFSLGQPQTSSSSSATTTKSTKSTASTAKAHHGRAAEAASWNTDQGEWSDVPVLPEGAQMKVIHGNPKTGASDLYVKMPSGYVAPFHWHTPNESVYMQAGSLELAMPNTSDTHTISPGGFFYAPSHMVHKATCTGNADCYFFLHSSGPFDIHLADAASSAK